MKSGDFQPTNFASTQSGLQAALDYAGTDLSGGTTSDGGEVYIGPGEITGITNLKMFGNTVLRGSPFAPSVLTRSASATGACIREYTTTEGNSRGATHIIVRDLMVKGNGSTGNGIDLGNGVIGDGSDTITLNGNAGIHHVTSRDFVGDGFKICANTVMFSDIHGPANTVGLRLTAGGGINRLYGVWMEGNTSENIICESSNNSFFGVHTEETVAGSQAAIKCSAGQNAFFDADIYLTQNRTDLITLTAGISGIYLENVTVRLSAAQTWTNTFRHLTYGTGTGAEARMSLRDTRANGYGKVFYWDSSTNASSTIESGNIAANALTVASTANVTGATTVSTIHATSTSQFDGNLTCGVAGASCVIQAGQGANDAFTSKLRVRSGDTGGAESSLDLQQNTTIKGRLFYNGTSTFLDATGGLVFRDAVGGTERARVNSTGLLVAGLTSGKYVKAGASGLLSDGVTPLSGTKIYYVADSSGGAVTRKLTFTDGILTAET
jgi:hypothetical protein